MPALGYFGIFEVEFLQFNGTWAMIDFNPRLFNQIGMDIHRGMPLPLLACLDAAGEIEALQTAVAATQMRDQTERTIFYDRFTLLAMLSALTITGRMTQKERSYWRSWTKTNANNAIDAAADISDPIPGMIHAMSEICLGLKAFPRFLRGRPRANPVEYSISGKASS